MEHEQGSTDAHLHDAHDGDPCDIQVLWDRIRPMALGLFSILDRRMRGCHHGDHRRIHWEEERVTNWSRVFHRL